MPTQTVYRRQVMAALDEPGIFACSSATSTTAVIATLASSASNHSPNQFATAWIYHLALSQVRIIREGSFIPGTGGMSVDPGWTAPTTNDELEITALFPSIMAGALFAQVGTDTDYRTLINRALSRLLAPDTISIPITTATSYSLSTYAAWLDRPERLQYDQQGRMKLFEPAVVSGRRAFSAAWRRPRLILDGAAPTLELDVPFTSATGNLTLHVLRPGDTLINGSESSVGLSAESDTALPSVNDVVTVTLMDAYRALMTRQSFRPSGRWKDRYDAQRKEAMALKYWDATQMAPPVAAAVQEAA